VATGVPSVFDAAAVSGALVSQAMQSGVFMSQISPVAAVPVLNYAGPTVPQRAAFNARRSWAWKGEHLFRVYITPRHLYFIRIGGARAQQQAIAYQGGLLGALIAHFAAKAAKKKQQKRVLENEDKPLDELMAGHKRNHTVAIGDISDAAIEAGGFWSGGTVRLTFNQIGEKKRVTCTFDTAEDTEAALRCLGAVMPGLRVGVVYNERKRRYEKIRL
jgi:hypothetical protein